MHAITVQTRGDGSTVFRTDMANLRPDIDALPQVIEAKAKADDQTLWEL